MFPLCSSFTGVKPSATSSTITANRPCGSHDLVVDGRTLDKDVPAGELLNSAPFTVGGFQWRIKVYPNDLPPIPIEEDEEYSYSYPRLPSQVQAFLVLDKNVADPVKARIKMSVMVHQSSFFSREAKLKVLHEWERAVTFTNRDDINFRGISFDRSKLASLLRRHKMDHFTIRCEVVVINGFRTEAPATAAVPPSDLHKHLGALLVTGTDADVVFEVGGEAFPAHRCVLAARSPVICKKLLGAASAKDAGGRMVRVYGAVQPRVFGALLRYLYTDALPEMDKDNKEGVAMYQDLLVAADRFDLVRLKMICENKLCKRVGPGNVMTMLVLANFYRCDGLEKACMDVLNNAPAKWMAVMAVRGQ